MATPPEILVGGSTVYLRFVTAAGKETFISLEAVAMAASPTALEVLKEWAAEARVDSRGTGSNQMVITTQDRLDAEVRENDGAVEATEATAAVSGIQATVNVPRIIRAMKEKGWGIRDTCVHCRMNNKTLSKILDGTIPRRLDRFFQLCIVLNVPMEEAVISPAREANSKRQGHVLPFRNRKSRS